MMTRTIRCLIRALTRASTGCLLGGALTIPLGPTTTGQAVDRMNQMSTRPLPSADARPVVRDDMVWVPDRTIRVPGQGEALVPGHWEQLTREFLLNRVWGYARADEIESRTVDVHVRRLRAKLGDEGRRIATVKSVGYRFERADEMP